MKLKNRDKPRRCIVLSGQSFFIAFLRTKLLPILYPTIFLSLLTDNIAFECTLEKNIVVFNFLPGSSGSWMDGEKYFYFQLQVLYKTMTFHRTPKPKASVDCSDTDPNAPSHLQPLYVVTLPLTNYQENMAQTGVLPATSTVLVKKNRVFQYSNHGASPQAKQFEGRRPERDAEGLSAGTIRGFSAPSCRNNPPRIDII
ncbi:hypothetical protein KQX54_005583 [Cotesia glomerata]|uniref:Uncharacterized protein n=1 Tax=Cotesia glomerata TaxID=32391 RepID=A0AAV7HV11_COTGL|nr:hypothetical protein KQX54_005583 [Cotesia glomerata]